MKKLLLLLASFLLTSAMLQAQVLVSINPNSGVRGTSINTTVTGSGGNFLFSSGPTTSGDFFMQYNATIIYPNSVNVIDNDHLSVNWYLPPASPVGTYQVTWDPCFFMGGGCQTSVPGGFAIGDAFITGKVWWDSDSSLTQNGTENGMFSKKLLLLPDSVITYSRANGDYTLAATAGLKSVKVQPGPYWNVTTDTSVNVNVNVPITNGINFGLKGVQDVYGIDVSITGGMTPRCFWTRTYVITFTNTGTVTTHGEVKYIRPNSVTFVSSTPNYNSVAGNTYTWNYTNLLPGESRDIYVHVNLPGGGTQITSTVQANAQDPLNNIVTQDEAFLNQVVVCAMDPNDKSVIPEGVQAPHYTLMSDSLDFVIRFQNTGTDTAFKVVILDTLNKNVLDLNTFQLITSSHPVVVDLRTNGRMTLTFDNILLPDSNVNEPLSHGWIRFRCLAKTGLPNNTVLNNTAHIYFDLNAAVVTNTTLNTLVYQIPVGISEAPDAPQVTVMPNPVTADATFNFPVPGHYELKVYDSSGRLVVSRTVEGTRAVIPARMLPKGVMLYQVRDIETGHRTNGRFVVM